MSDIDKAEELLKRFMEITDPDRSYHPEMESALRFQIKEYFKKPVVIQDWNDESVRIYVDSDKDVSFKWGGGDGTPNIVAFQPEELVRGLREIGVVQ